MSNKGAEIMEQQTQQQMHTKRRGRWRMRLAGIGAVLAVAAALSAFAFNGAHNADSTAPQQFAHGDITANAAWKARYDQTRQSVVSDLARQVLADDTITQAEVTQISDAYAHCLAASGIGSHMDRGLVAFEYDKSKDGDVEYYDVTNNQIHACLNSTDYKRVIALYGEMSWNKGNLSPEELNARTLDCLKQHDLADASMTAKQFNEIMMGASDKAQQLNEQHFDKYMNRANPQYNDSDAKAFAQCEAGPAAQ
jgi:hypothetical protein